MNGVKNQVLILNSSVVKEMQQACFGHLEEEIAERHDRLISEAEKTFRLALGWPDDDEAIDACWEHLNLRIQAMYLEMIEASFVAGIQLGYGLGGGCAHTMVRHHTTQLPAAIKGVEA